MGLLEDIGNTVGNAVGAVADFIASGFSGIIDFVGTQFKQIGTDIIQDAMLAVQDPEEQISEDAQTIADTITAPMETGFKKHMDEFLKNHSEITPEQADTEVNTLWDKIRLDVGVMGVTGLVIEGISAGQIEGGFKMFDMADRVSGMTGFANTKAMMDYQAKFFVPYQRYLNWTNPNVIPGPSDIVRFGLREVYDEDRRKELLKETPSWEYYRDMNENGYNNYHSDNYWASHWVLPSVGQLNEMLHRDVIDEADWDRFVKYNDFDPMVRPWLKAISYRPYTRVDVRRMYDVGVLDDVDLPIAYKELGFNQEKADMMTLWTKVYNAVGELRARYSKGWITKEELKQSFIDLGMKEEKAQTFMEKLVKSETDTAAGKQRDLTKTDITRSVARGLISKEDGIDRLIELGYDEQEATLLIDAVVKAAVAEEIEVDRDVSKTEIIEGVKLGIITRSDSIPMLTKLGYSIDEANYILDLRVLPVHVDRIIKERDLTKAEIIKGVKKEILTENQAVTMLEDMGYDNAEAWYIIDINVEALAGSPEAWSEFQRIVNRDRKARGQPTINIPPEIPQLEKQIKTLEKTLSKAKKDKKPRQATMDLQATINPLKRHLNKLIKEYKE